MTTSGVLVWFFGGFFAYLFGFWMGRRSKRRMVLQKLAGGVQVEWEPGGTAKQTQATAGEDGGGA